MAVEIKSSKIQGKGVFAASNFKKGDVVMKWDASIMLTEKQAKKIAQKDRKYLVFYKSKYILAQPPEKYLNHSCTPNTKEGKLCDIALRNIKKGEELTTDYSIDAPPHIKMKCRCGCRNCRKII
jgi:SET domain-containing protein